MSGDNDHICKSIDCTCSGFQALTSAADPKSKQQQEGQVREDESSNSSIQSQQQSSVKDDLEVEIREIREEFRTHFTRCKELVKRLGNVIKKAGIVKESDICHEVKNILAEEIAAQDITVRTIERYCPDEWKRTTKPKPTKKNDNLSFSPKPLVAVTQDGKSETEEIAPISQGQQSMGENPTSTDSGPEQDIEKPVAPMSISVESTAATPTTSIEQESAAVRTQEHRITIMLQWDTLSEQMGEVHSPGIEWVQLSGALDEKGIMSNLKLTNIVHPSICGDLQEQPVMQ
jgi:hypothetical protein